MSDKRMRNTKTFIVVTGKSAYFQRRGKTTSICCNAIKQRLRVGAKDEKQARKLVKEFVDSSTSINAIWEADDEPKLPRGMVVDDLERLKARCRYV